MSKSGIGGSFGVKGFRVGARPDGSTYVHAGRKGLYYRKELGKKKRTNSTKNQSNYGQNNHIRPKRKYRSETCIYEWAAYFGLILSLAALVYNIVLGLIIGLLSVVYVIEIYKWELKKKSTFMQYKGRIRYNKKIKPPNLPRTIYNEYDRPCTDILILMKCDKVWLINNIDECESRANAGASIIVDRIQASCRLGLPLFVSSNIQMLEITAGIRLYFAPDGIFVHDRLTFIRYDELKISYRSIEFVEDKPLPADAKIIGYTWAYANYDGSPDLRFNNNYQIPVCEYGIIKIEKYNPFRDYYENQCYDPNPFSIELFVSQSRYAKMFVNALT